MERPIMSDREFRIIQLKSELFDLQGEMAQCRVKMEEKIKELNKMLQERGSNDQT